MNKPVYLGLSILEINKIVIYVFWYNYVNGHELCYMDIDSFLVNIKQKTFTFALQRMVKQDLILQIMN